MREFLNLTRALADPTRLRVLLALQGRELCACQITELFGLAQSTMSKHFYILKQGGLIDSRKDGRWVYYALPGPDADSAVQEALTWVRKALGSDPRVVEDRKNLKKILQCDRATLCKRQLRR